MLRLVAISVVVLAACSGAQAASLPSFETPTIRQISPSIMEIVTPDAPLAADSMADAAEPQTTLSPQDDGVRVKRISSSIVAIGDANPAVSNELVAGIPAQAKPRSSPVMVMRGGIVGDAVNVSQPAAAQGNVPTGTSEAKSPTQAAADIRARARGLTKPESSVPAAAAPAQPPAQQPQ